MEGMKASWLKDNLDRPPRDPWVGALPAGLMDKKRGKNLGRSYGSGPKAWIHISILGKVLIRWISVSSLALCLVPFSCVFLIPAVSHPAEVTISWSPSTDAKVAGYMVHYGPSGQDSEFQADARKETKITLTNLREGASYSFAVNTYDIAGVESRYSRIARVINLKDKETHVLSILPSPTPSPSSTSNARVQEKPFPDTPPGCEFTLLPASQSIGSSGGGGAVGISTKLSCPWTVIANVPWVVITSNNRGMGSTVVYYLVKANPNASSRDGTLALAGQTFKIIQRGRARHRLSINKIGTGSGTVASDPAGTDFEAGTVLTLRAAPTSSSTFAGWSGRCSGTKPICRIEINSGTEVSASFKLKTFVIAANAGPHGSIIPSGRVMVNYGASQNFIFKPNEGYQVGQVRVDGESVGDPENLLLGNVMKSHRIDAIFTPIHGMPKK